MGFSCSEKWPNLFISLSLFLLINTKTSDQASDRNLVNEICPKTRNPAFCFHLLGHLGGASLHDLCEASIGPTQDLAFFAADEARVLLMHGRDPALKNVYRSCLGSYEQTSVGLSGVERLLGAGNLRSLPAQASATLAKAGACDRQFQPPASEPAQLKKASSDLEDGCSVVLVISNLLATSAM
ncbi:pectinesterase inhibitor-like [Dorcoceras hygrometricum]|uniref:Pectinesterase inhibitor-like n=1 Tax=Dorcoceras hygrometricum TaxID=472368 RepID=A0A2Z7BUB8_9LAMI|nr:pectinesterase inhibitor-like [Dorcoceras hygrometricum]